MLGRIVAIASLSLFTLTACGPDLCDTERYDADAYTEEPYVLECTEVTGDLRVFHGISAPNLVSVGGDLEVVPRGSNVEIDFPALQTVGGNFNAIGSPNLGTISAPALNDVGRDLTVSGNASLTSLDLSALGSVGRRLLVSDNAMLPECAVLAWAEGVTVGGETQVFGNLDDSPCP